MAAAMLWLLLHLPSGDCFPRGHRTLLRHVALYDPVTGALEADRDLLWEDGLIIRAAPGGSLDPEACTVVDGRGLWAMPALADAAVFLSLEGRYPGTSVPAEAQESLRLQAASGMGGVLDLNASRAFIHAAKALGGTLPRARFAGALFTAPGGWRILAQTPWDSHVVEVQEEDDLTAAWGRVLRFQDQAIFASVEDEGRDGLSIPLPVLTRLGALAHERGLPFIIQAHHAAKALAALPARPDALMGPFFDLDEAPGLAAAMLGANCAYIPALSSVLNAFPPEPLGAWLRRFPAAKELDPSVLDQAEDPQNSDLWIKHWTRQGVVPSKIRDVLKSLGDAGVRLDFGTASGMALVFHGLGAQTEMAQWRWAGLSPRQILLAATVNSHALAGLPGGRLRRGDPADLLLMDGNPGEDPDLAVHPKRVFLGGLEVPQ
jgi:imidazolonepropionase-like amidohydrolase